MLLTYKTWYLYFFRFQLVNTGYVRKKLPTSITEQKFRLLLSMQGYWNNRCAWFIVGVRKKAHPCTRSPDILGSRIQEPPTHLYFFYFFQILDFWRLPHSFEASSAALTRQRSIGCVFFLLHGELQSSPVIYYRASYRNLQRRCLVQSPIHRVE